jgi:hypothetical protein
MTILLGVKPLREDRKLYVKGPCLCRYGPPLYLNIGEHVRA